MSGDLINELTHRFTGRQWLFDAIDRWLSGASSRTLLMTGEPGAGKSAVAAKIISLSKGQAGASKPAFAQALAAYHFCLDRDDATLAPHRFVESLSGQLALRYPPFASMLGADRHGNTITIDATQRVDTVGDNAVVQNVVINKIDLGTITPARDSFDRLARQPLQHLYNSRELREPILILIDSLDEALTFDRDTENTIVGVLQHLNPLPPNVFFLLTSRRNSRIEPALQEPSIDLIDDAPDIVQDIESYAITRLTSLTPDHASRLAKRVAEASKGNFLYAKFVLDDIERHGVPPIDIKQLDLPDGLQQVYQGFLQRDLVSNGDKWESLYRPLLGLLAIARGSGLSRDHLLGVTNMRAPQLGDAVVACLPYVRGDMPSGPFQPYHSSFRDYLLMESEHPVYPAQASVDLAGWLYNKNKGRWSQCHDDYAILHTIRHLSEAIQSDIGQQHGAYLAKALTDVATDVGYLQKKIERAGVDDLITDLRKAIGSLSSDDPGRPDVIAVERVIELERHNLRLATSSELPLSLRPSVLRQLQFRATSLGLRDFALRVQEAEDGKKAARLRLVAVSGAEDRARIRLLAGHFDVVKGVAASADGKTGFSGDHSGLVNVWELETGRSLWSSKLSSNQEIEWLECVAISRDGRFGLTGYSNGVVAVWNLQTGEVGRLPSGRTSRISTLAVNVNGTRALAGSEDGTVTYWNLETREPISVVEGFAYVMSVCISAAGDYGIVGDRRGGVTGLDFVENRRTFSSQLHSNQVQSVSLSEDERLAISCGADGIVYIFSPRGGLLGGTVPQESNEWLYRAIFTPDAALVITSAADNKVRLWNVENKSLIYRFIGHSGGVNGLDLCGPSRAISCGGDNNIIIWDLKLAQELYQQGISAPTGLTPGHADWVRSVAIAPNAQLAASGAFDQKAILWRLNTGDCIDTLPTLAGPVRSVGLSGDGERLLTLCLARQDNIAIVWDVSAKRPICRMTDLKLTGWGGALSSNGTQAAAATIERNLCLWDVRSGEVRATFSGHETPIYCAAFGPNDETLLTGGGPRSILWAAKTCEILEVFQGGTGPVWAVALSPDGRLAATGSQDSAGRVWDTKTGKLLAALEAHTAPVTAVGFIAEGTYLITGSQDKNLFLWDVASGEVVDTLYLAHKVSCGAAHKNLAILGDYGGAVYFFAVDNV